MFRSMLLVPGDDLHKISKAINSGADAVLIDLEDSVADSAKANARELMSQVPVTEVPIYVRVNSIWEALFIDDVNAVVNMECRGIVVPKVESAADMDICNWYLSQAERMSNRSEGELDVIPVVETAKGIGNIREIFEASTRSSRASYGAGDLTADTGMVWTEDELPLHAIRTKVVIESKAAGLLPPLDTPHWEFRDIELLRASAVRGRQLGFGAKLCIHPAQIPVIHEVFSPTAAELQWAKQVVEEFEAAEAQGKGCITVNGQMVDYAVAKRAKNILCIPVEENT